MKNKLLFASLCIGVCYLINLYSQTPGPNKNLLEASKKGNHNKISGLIKMQGADINTTDEQKRTPVMIASKEDNITFLTELLEYDPKLDEQDSGGNTALILAINPSPDERITKNTKDIVEKLLEHDADPTIANKEKITALDLVNKKKTVDDLTKQTKKLLNRYIHKASK